MNSTDLTNALLAYMVVSMAWRDLPKLSNQVRRRLARRARVIRAKFRG